LRGTGGVSFEGTLEEFAEEQPEPAIMGGLIKEPPLRRMMLTGTSMAPFSMALCDEEVHPIWCNYFIKTNFSGSPRLLTGYHFFLSHPLHHPRLQPNLLPWLYLVASLFANDFCSFFYRPYKFNGCLLYL
jgi:hypothetical protein